MTVEAELKVIFEIPIFVFALMTERNVVRSNGWKVVGSFVFLKRRNEN